MGKKLKNEVVLMKGLGRAQKTRLSKTLQRKNH